MESPEAVGVSGSALDEGADAGVVEAEQPGGEVGEDDDAGSGEEQGVEHDPRAAGFVERGGELAEEERGQAEPVGGFVGLA